jgi:hypothetical protein
MKSQIVREMEKKIIAREKKFRKKIERGKIAEVGLSKFDKLIGNVKI